MTFIQDRRQMGDTFAGHTDLEVTVCTCGVLFAAPQKLLDTRRFDGQSFYCPNGHSLSFKGTEGAHHASHRSTGPRQPR
jgi:hypothetical protein